MKLLEDLRSHILSLPGEIKIDPDDLLTFADDGKIISTAEGSNAHFELNYKANIIVQNYSGGANKLFYWVLLWLAKNIPNHPPEALKWQADILNQHSTDLSLTLELNEIIKAKNTDQGVQLNYCGQPQVETEMLSAKEWSLYIVPESITTPVAQWIDGG